MKKNQIAVLLAAVVLPASAGWQLLDTDRVGNRVFYDPATVERRGGVVQVWEISDLHERNALGFLSYRNRHEFDCAGRKHRVTFTEAYREAMATGKAAAPNGEAEGQWSEFNPGSAMDRQAKVICAP
jgi:hypothetical protein